MGSLNRPRTARLKLGAAVAAALAVVGCVPDGDGGGSGSTTTTTVPIGTPTRNFLLRTDIAAGTKPRNIQVADLNLDGRRDLVTVTGTTNDSVVSVQLATAGGGYASPVPYAAGGVIWGIALGDTNGDGNVDIVAANTTAGTLSVLLGHTNGTFDSPLLSTIGGAPGNYNGTRALALGDLDGDGKLDGVVADGSGASRVSVLKGAGNGTFTATVVAVPQASSRGVGLGDLNGDGKLDLAVLSDTQSGLSFSNSILSTRLGVGNGTFGASVDTALPTSSFNLALGDLNGDGKLDVGATSYFTSTNIASAYTLLGNGSGGLGAVGVTPRWTTGGGGLGDIALADLNGDGRSDIVTGNQSRNQVQVGIAGPGGVFGAADLYFADGNGGGGNRAIAVADMTGDGAADIVWAAADTDRIELFRNRGDGRFGAIASTPGSPGRQVVIADATGDSIPDLVTPADSNNTFHVAAGLGGGRFADAESHPTGNKPYSVAVGDLNADGKPDVVTADNGAATVSVSLGTGGGAFAAPAAYAVGGTPQRVIITDLNGDGKPDVVSANTGGGGVSVLLGNGSGALGTATSIGTGASPLAVVAGDLNGDGKIDLVVTNSLSNTASVLRGRGDGTFDPKVDYATAANPQKVALGDLNGDGKSDLVVAAYDGQVVSVLAGNGDATFQAKVDSPASGKITDVAVADFNGDGRADVAVASHDNNTAGLVGAGVMWGNGSGSLSAPASLLISRRNVLSLAAGDVNGDGTPDLVFGEVSDGHTLWAVTG